MKLMFQCFHCLKSLLSCTLPILLFANLCTADCSVLNSENAWDKTTGCCFYDSRNHVLDCNNASISKIEK